MLKSSEVESATTKQLLAAYNAATGKHVKKFASRTEAERLARKALLRWEQSSLLFKERQCDGG